MFSIFGVRKIAPLSGSGFGLGLALELGQGGNFLRGRFSWNPIFLYLFHFDYVK